MDKPAPFPRPNLYERRADRVALFAEVALRRSGKHNFRVPVFDLSPLGCKLEFVERLDIDEVVWVKFDGLEAVQAQVCWTAGFKAGLVFATPIHPAVFGQLLGRLAR